MPTYGELALNAANNAIVDRLDAGGTIEIRTGAPPANNAAADSGTLLATFTLPTTPFGAASYSTGVSTSTLNHAGISDATATATGTAGHYRYKNTGSVCEIQGAVDDGLTLSSNDITAGQTVRVTSGQHTVSDPS